MAPVLPATRRRQHVFDDSHRWERFTPRLDDMIARVDAIPHRRFIKTHSPADCTPIFTECRYLAVYRDGRDALVSWANHRRKMRREVIEALSTLAARDGVAPW